MKQKSFTWDQRIAIRGTCIKLEQNQKCKNVLNTSQEKTYWNVESVGVISVLRTKGMYKASILVSSENLSKLIGPAETTYYKRRNHIQITPFRVLQICHVQMQHAQRAPCYITSMNKDETVSRDDFYWMPESRIKPFFLLVGHGMTDIRHQLMCLFVFFLFQVNIWPWGHHLIIISPPCM